MFYSVNRETSESHLRAPLWIEDLQQLLCDKRIYNSSSVKRGHPAALLWIEDLIRLLCEKRSSCNFSVKRGLPEAALRMFCSSTANKRPRAALRWKKWPPAALLWKKDLQQLSVKRGPPWAPYWSGDLIQLLYEKRISSSSYPKRGPPAAPLRKEDFKQLFFLKKDLQQLLFYSQIFFCWVKTSCCSSVDGGTPAAHLLVEDPSCLSNDWKRPRVFFGLEDLVETFH